MIVRHLNIHMRDDEWGNELMLRLAQKAFARDSQLTLVTVYEHGGWFLSFTRRGLIVETANDAATAAPDRYRVLGFADPENQWVELEAWRGREAPDAAAKK